MTRALRDRLAVVYDVSPAATVMAGTANWHARSFGDPIADVRTIVPHITAGWPSRNKVREFVTQYTTRNIARWGEGPQFYVAGDGTAFRVIDVPRVTYHATFVNSWSMGIESGNLFATAAPPRGGWIQLNRNAATRNDDDLPGYRLWVRDHRDVPREVVVGAWTTARFAGPRRTNAFGAGRMLLTEWQYRTLSLLVRYLAEEYRIPRNVPVLPHVLRGDVVRNSDELRRIVLADPGFDDIVAALAAFQMAAADFTPANAATLQARYTTIYNPAQNPHGSIHLAGNGFKQHNLAWRALFGVYRGFHGHGFSGAIGLGQHDHDCPGPLFDWHRFARELWDWWWFPFDANAVTTAVPRREYQNPTGTTPLHEYYFDENEATRTARIREGVHGPTSSPETFQLDRDSPVYAMANGELVAARIPPGDPNQPSTAFVLLRHDVFHLPHPLRGPLFPGFALWPAGTLDHAREPTSVYTLYMHLGRQGGINFDSVSADNPDWLNRVIARKKECDLGVTFYDGHPTHHGIPDAAWNSTPPGAARSTMLELWRLDQFHLGGFLSSLRNGDVAIGPSQSDLCTPINVLLGDHLGRAGVYSRDGGVPRHGVRIEAFSRDALPGFSTALTQNWSPPAGLPNPPALFYPSEWARAPTNVEADRLRAHGFDPAAPSWWAEISLRTTWSSAISELSAWLIPFGGVWHYRALDVARWLNDLTWQHERTKYRSATAAAMARPPSRRV